MAKATTVDTNRKCLGRLRKLGYAKADLQMTRVATTYTVGGKLNSPLSISLGKGNDSFIVTDRDKNREGGSLTFISSAMHISNLAQGAQAKAQEIMCRAMDKGLLTEGQTINNYELLIAIAELGLVTEGRAEA